MANREVENPDDGVPRWWGIVCLLCGVPFFLILANLGHPGKGLVAVYSVALIVLVARIFWQSSRYGWYWGLLCTTVLYHIVALLFIDFPKSSYPIVIVAAPLVFLDFSLVFFAFKTFEKRTRLSD